MHTCYLLCAFVGLIYYYASLALMYGMYECIYICRKGVVAIYLTMPSAKRCYKDSIIAKKALPGLCLPHFRLDSKDRQQIQSLMLG